MSIVQFDLSIPNMVLLYSRRINLKPRSLNVVVWILGVLPSSTKMPDMVSVFQRGDVSVVAQYGMQNNINIMTV